METVSAPRRAVGDGRRVRRQRVLHGRKRQARLLSLHQDRAPVTTNAQTLMLQIDRIVLREIRLTLKEPFRISSGVCTERRIGLLEFTDVDGAVGWSECVAGEQPNYSPETIDTAWLAIKEWLAPRVLRRAFDGPEAVFPVLDRNIRGHNMA